MESDGTKRLEPDVKIGNICCTRSNGQVIIAIGDRDPIIVTDRDVKFLMAALPACLLLEAFE